MFSVFHDFVRLITGKNKPAVAAVKQSAGKLRKKAGRLLL